MKKYAQYQDENTKTKPQKPLSVKSPTKPNTHIHLKGYSTPPSCKGGEKRKIYEQVQKTPQVFRFCRLLLSKSKVLYWE